MSLSRSKHDGFYLPCVVNSTVQNFFLQISVAYFGLAESPAETLCTFAKVGGNARSSVEATLCVNRSAGVKQGCECLE